MSKAKALPAIFLLLTLSMDSAFSQAGGPQPREETKTARILGAVLGGVGGLLLAGSLVDDDRNTTGEFMTALIVAPAAGAVGGYFIGRAIDKKRSSYAYAPDLLNRQKVLDQIVASETRRLRALDSRTGAVDLPETLQTRSRDLAR